MPPLSDPSPLGQPGDRPPRRVMRRVLLAEWQAGQPLVAMERRHRMAHRTVRRLLEEAGADLPPRRDMFDLRGSERAAFAATLTAEFDANKDLTVHALAKRHHVSPQTVRKLIREARYCDHGEAAAVVRNESSQQRHEEAGRSTRAPCGCSSPPRVTRSAVDSSGASPPGAADSSPPHTRCRAARQLPPASLPYRSARSGAKALPAMSSASRQGHVQPGTPSWYDVLGDADHAAAAGGAALLGPQELRPGQAARRGPPRHYDGCDLPGGDESPVWVTAPGLELIP